MGTRFSCAAVVDDDVVVSPHTHSRVHLKSHPFLHTKSVHPQFHDQRPKHVRTDGDSPSLNEHCDDERQQTADDEVSKPFQTTQRLPSHSPTQSPSPSPQHSRTQTTTNDLEFQRAITRHSSHSSTDGTTDHCVRNVVVANHAQVYVETRVATPTPAAESKGGLSDRNIRLSIQTKGLNIADNSGAPSSGRSASHQRVFSDSTAVYRPSQNYGLHTHNNTLNAHQEDYAQTSPNGVVNVGISHIPQSYHAAEDGNKRPVRPYVTNTPALRQLQPLCEEFDSPIIFTAIAAYHREFRDEGLGPSWYTAHQVMAKINTDRITQMTRARSIYYSASATGTQTPSECPRTALSFLIQERT